MFRGKVLSMWCWLSVLLLALTGCEEEVKEEELVAESEVVGTWIFASDNRNDSRDLKMAFHSRGKFEHQNGKEWLVGLWHLDEKDVVVKVIWMKQPNGEELDMQTSGVMQRYHVKMRGKNTLLVEQPQGATLTFAKTKKHTGLFNKDIGLAVTQAASDPAPADKKDEKKSGH